MNRLYTSTANFRAPYNNVEFAGLGNAPTWPAGRSYHSTANFMATQDEGYFQDNSLFGLGAVAQRPITKSANPAEVARRYAAKVTAAAAAPPPAPEKKSSALIPVLAILAVAAAGGVYWYMRRK